MLKYICAFLSVIILFYSVTVVAQVNSSGFEGQWKKVDDFVKKGLTKSALEEVAKIYSSAKKSGNDIQLIKCLLYELNLNQDIQEDAGVKNLEEVETETVSAKQPAKSILQCISAKMYWNFFQHNRWNIYNRTNTVNFVKSDIKTWTADDFHKKIGQLYMASIKEEKLLQQTKLDRFDPILIKGNVRYLRPALYDLLANEALQYFKNDERDISRPSYAFEIKDEKAFASSAEFMSHKFSNKDSASLHYYAIVIYQRLLSFHANDPRPDALIDADISRIQFAEQYGVMTNKNDLYLDALKNVYATYVKNAASSQAGYLVAQHIFSQVDEERTSDDSLFINKVIEAKNWAEKVSNKFPGSEGGINAKNLLNEILRKEITLTSEKVNVPGQPFRTLVTYKNMTAIYLRIIDLTTDFKASLEQKNDNDQLWKKLTSQKFLKSWKQELPVTNDYSSHSVEIKIDSLPVGQYALLSSVSEEFGLVKNPLAVQYFHVSDISFINNGFEYFTLHRETGKPLAGAKVQIWNQQYDYKLNRNVLQKQELITSDKNGHFTITEKNKNGKGKIVNENRNIRLEITYEKDRLFLDDYQNSYRYYNNDDADADEYDINDAKDVKEYEGEKAKIFLFTDRSIYRPGQLVYFKGIAVTRNLKSRRSKLFQSKDSIWIALTDANNQKIDSIKLFLNEYGSINGKFRLPENRLNGNFEISAGDFENASTSFSVEEYKRPKFYAELEKIKGTYRVNDKIKLNGFAKAYAGINIDGANVKYRVTRVARFLYPWMFWRWPMPRTESLEITHGEITTGADGKFSIEFEAIPDLSIDKKTDPVFDYKVEADVTDINGETRSTSATVPVGYKALDLQIRLPRPDAINVDSLKQIFVSSKNLSGEFEPAKVDVKIYKLETPKRIIRNRYWQQPDKFIMSREEYLKYFPNDEYIDETKKETWAKGRLAFETNDSTTPNPKFKIQNEKFLQGWYVAEATAKDKYGQDVKDVKYFQLYDIKSPSLPMPAYYWDAAITNTVEPGNDAKFIAGTSATDLFIIQHIDKSVGNSQQLNSAFEFYSLTNEKKNFEFAAKEEDRGGFGVYQFFVKDNRVYSNTWNINVPWTNKQLDISYETYRDKTLPGSEEKWKVKIAGYKGEKVAAEMLAGMYDASLDQFKPQRWNMPAIWPTFYRYNGWASVQNFSSVQSMVKWIDDEYVEQKEKRYDVLIFENSLGNDLPIRGINLRESNGDTKMNVLVLSSQKGERVKTIQFTPPKLVKDEELAKPSDAAQSKNDDNVKNPINQSQTQIRKNFNETAFFFPELRTDKNGNIEFNFTMPEALTQWKLMTLAYTKDLAMGYSERTVVTQKQLMVQPNAPRFVREGDSMEFSAKVVNLDTTQVSGQVQLQLLNASTMNSVDGIFKNNSPLQNFSVAAGQSIAVKFNIAIPVNYNDALVYRIIAKAAGTSDGEEAAMPVLTNRMLVTETIPLNLKSFGTKSFTFKKLLQSGNSNTISNHALTIEFTSNPAWYAIQALPYLMEYPYQCAEQTFNRYYANSIAAKIANSSPKIKAVFEKWKVADTAALLSNLQKNEELKSLLLEETPWVVEAQNETQQKKNIALLFDMMRMSNEMESSLTTLMDMQSPNGGFVWFKGGPDDRYITQYIVTSIGHLKKLNAFNPAKEGKLKTILNLAIPYLDKKLKSDYDELMKSKRLSKLPYTSYPGGLTVQYLYMRSFFPEYPIAKEVRAAYDYYQEQSKKSWLNQTKYMQAMIALSLYRNNDNNTARSIMRSLKENAINNEEMGMYWKEWDSHGYWWYQAPIESQALMIEAFNEIDKDEKIVTDLKTWLLKNKQTNNWHTTKATAEACYALLLQGTDWLSQEKKVTLSLGGTTINSTNETQEEGSGYFKTKIQGDKVIPDMGNISVTLSNVNKSSKVLPSQGEGGFGAAYWQYFENLDKISFAETPLKLTKKLFIEKNTDRGPVLTPVNDEADLKIGDKIKVRIELRVDRDMEYVHMKDMRASCMEPTNVISEYKYQGGLGYYETTKDASTNFFFNYLNKGTYVFEYALFVTHAGNFSNGVTTIQCMYAPEFTAHSEGIRVKIK